VGKQNDTELHGSMQVSSLTCSELLMWKYRHNLLPNFEKHEGMDKVPVGGNTRANEWATWCTRQVQYRKNTTYAAVYWNATKSYKDILLTTLLLRYNLAIYTTRMHHDNTMQPSYQIKCGKKWQMSFL